MGFWRKKGRRGNGRLDGSFSCAASVSGGDDGDGGVGFDSSCSSGSDVGSRCRRGGCGDGESEVKITRFRRNGSLLNVSGASTHFWVCDYLSTIIFQFWNSLSNFFFFHMEEENINLNFFDRKDFNFSWEK